MKPGTLLLVDRFPREPRAGDILFFRDSRDELRLGRVGGAEHAAPEGYVWLTVDPTGCPSPSSEDEGPFEISGLLGRLVMSLPW